MEYQDFIKEYQIVPSKPMDYDGFLEKYSTPKKKKAVMEEQSFIAKHPNLYGAFGAAQSLIPYLKYVDPTEREKFANLSTQEQTRDLLIQNLETVAMVAAPVITKGVVPIVARFLPKTYKALKFIKAPIKEMGELARTPAKEVAGKGMAELESKVAQKIATYKRISGEHPKPETIKGWWSEAAAGVEKKIPPGAKPVVVSEKPTVTDDPVRKITAAIKEAKPIRKVQEQIYSQERAKRLGKAMAVGEKIPGEKGFVTQLGKLKGELTKVEFESIRSKVGQKDIDALFDIVNKSGDVTGFQNITAKAGLAKILGVPGGKVPTEGELVLLRKIFPADFTKALLKKRPLLKRMGEAGLQLANIPRSIMASFDLSAPFRQGLFLGPSHPKRFTQAFMKMFRLFGSDDALTALQESIAQKPTYKLMKESGLMLTKVGEGMALREEAFMSQWAEKIPLIGRVVRASGRAHMGFLNKLRADVFEDLVMKAERLGLDPQNNMDLTKQIAKFVNAGSGRGSLGGLERSATVLNAFFFSPRLMASRLTLLNPVYYIKQDPFVRKEALKSLFILAGTAGTILGVAKAGGAKVSSDLKSADAFKIKIGNTRIDILGGFQQYMRAAGQLITGKYVSTTTGKVVTLGEGYRPLTRLEILHRQIESKEAPIFSFLTTLMKGQDITGEKISVPKEIAKRFIPMAMSDIYEIAQEDPDLLPISFLGIFGVGLQTYKGRPPKLKGGIKGLQQ